MHILRALVLVLLCGEALVWGEESTNRWVIEARDGANFSLETGTATATNGVVVKYGGGTLTAEKATVNQETGEVEAEGHVKLEREAQVWAGERLSYNFKTGQILAQKFRSGHTPFFIQGEALAADRKANLYAGTEAWLTTDDSVQPGYSVRSKSILIVPGDYIEARQAVLYLGTIPVFYYPYYRRSLKRHPNNFVFTPGYRSLYGPYLRSSYNWYWDERLGGAVHVDTFGKRGVGVGPDLSYHLPRFGDGTFRYYYIKDQKPGFDSKGVPIAEDRQRLWFSHSTDITSNLTAKVMMRYQSDAEVVRDFFETEYRKNVQPNSSVEVDQLWSNYSLNLFVQPQLNRFFETVERLPDVRFTAFRQQLGVTPLYYESESSLGYYRRQFATGTTNLPYAAFRGDTFQQVVLPWTFFNWLNVTPRVGGRFTHYEEATGPGAYSREENRGVFNTGAELSTKASRLWPGAQSRFWEINGLRHILQPSVNYVYVPHPSVAPPKLPQFDYELPSTRLLPIEFPDYNAIDSIDSQNVLRLGLRNKLQTKRALGIDNVANWALYTDWRLQPRAGQGTFANLYSDLDLKPFSWLTFNSETRYDLNTGQWPEANHHITVAPTDVWSVSLGHRYLRDDPAFGPDGGNNLIYGSVYYRLNENWAARATIHFEARDGTMEEQQYTVYRDLRSLTTALTFRVRDNRNGPTDWAVAFTMSLKAFPRFALDSDRDQPSLLLGD